MSSPSAPAVRVPRVAIVVSPRSWAETLHRHLADHGGALVRARVLDAREALDEDYDVLVCEDLTSFLSARIVKQLREQGRELLGLHDPRDPTGRRRLQELGVDAVLTTDVGPERILDELETLAASTLDLDEELRRLVETPAEVVAPAPGPLAGLVAVGGAGGGPGASEVAIGLAAAWSPGVPTALIDLDLVGPALAQRLGLPLEPNLLSALEHFERGGDPTAVLHRVGDLAVCTGLVDPRDWASVPPDATHALVTTLRTTHDIAVVDLGHRLDSSGRTSRPHSRQDVARAITTDADVIVGVVSPQPVGVARFLDWVAEVRTLTSASVHVVINAARDRDRWAVDQVATELRRLAPVDEIWKLPFDERVVRGAWDGRLVRGRRHRRLVARIADGVQDGLRRAGWQPGRSSRSHR